MRVIVTGGMGFIGRHVEGIPVDIKSGTDLRVDPIDQFFPADVVVHLSAYKDVGESFNQSVEYWENNVSATVRLLRAMKRGGVNKIVFASSAAVYGCSPYGQTKLACEKLIKSSGMDYVILRIQNPIGIGSGGVIQALSSGKVVINGSDYPTRDGTCERDYLCVSDVGRAVNMSVRYLKNHGRSLNFDIGTGKGTTVLELCGYFSPVNISFGPRRRGDLMRSVANPETAKRVLGWGPSSLEKAIEGCRISR